MSLYTLKPLDLYPICNLSYTSSTVSYLLSHPYPFIYTLSLIDNTQSAFFPPKTPTGITVYSGGLTVTAGVTIKSGGLWVNNAGITILQDGLTVTGGLTVYSQVLCTSSPRCVDYMISPL